MRIRTFGREYQDAARKAVATHLADLGFTLRKDGRLKVLAAESAHCRIYFDLNELGAVQRVSADPGEHHPIYNLRTILEASGSDPDALARPDSLEGLIGRVACTLASECRPVLQGDSTARQRVDEIAKERDRRFVAKLAEAGIHLKDGDEWRELPGLDSVSVNGPNLLGHAVAGVAITLALLAFLALPVYVVVEFFTSSSYARDRADTPAVLFFALLFGSVPVIAELWVAKQVFRTQYSWHTSPDGLTVRYFLKRQTIPWDSIRSADFAPGSGYELRTTHGSVVLHKSAMAHAVLEASIWQHLNRAGVTNKPILSPFAASLWAQIPDEGIDELQWEHADQPPALDILLRMAAWQTAIWGTAVLVRFRLAFPLLLAAIWSAGRGVSSLVTIRRVCIRSDRIEAATPLARLVIPWGSVRTVFFIQESFRPPSVVVRARFPRSFQIPWRPEHPNSTRVILAILRRLREEERFKLLPFPVDVLLVAHGDEEVV